MAVKILLRQYQAKLAQAFLSQDKLHRTADRWKEDYGKLMWRDIGERGLYKDYRDWLFKDGIIIVKENRATYLYFIDELESSKFMLMYM